MSDTIIVIPYCFEVLKLIEIDLGKTLAIELSSKCTMHAHAIGIEPDADKPS
jgi:hypothetical protein